MGPCDNIQRHFSPSFVSGVPYYTQVVTTDGRIAMGSLAAGMPVATIEPVTGAVAFLRPRHRAERPFDAELVRLRH